MLHAFLVFTTISWQASAENMTASPQPILWISFTGGPRSLYPISGQALGLSRFPTTGFICAGGTPRAVQKQIDQKRVDLLPIGEDLLVAMTLRRLWLSQL